MGVQTWALPMSGSSERLFSARPGGYRPGSPPRRHSVSRREPANVLSYALKRLVTVVPTLLVIITVAFFMMRLAPGGPFDSDRALPPDIEQNIKAAYDLDKPLVRSEERRGGQECVSTCRSRGSPY